MKHQDAKLLASLQEQKEKWASCVHPFACALDFESPEKGTAPILLACPAVLEGKGVAVNGPYVKEVALQRLSDSCVEDSC